MLDVERTDFAGRNCPPKGDWILEKRGLVKLASRWRSPKYALSVLRFVSRRQRRRLRLAAVYVRRRLGNPLWLAEHRPDFERGLARCEVRYINLAARTDRRREMESLFRKLAIQAHRVEASFAEQGILGCARSHILALAQPSRNEKLLMICEDDLDFLVGRKTLDMLIDEFYRNPGLDVLCLGYNLRAKPIPISRDLQLTENTQTTSCYVVKTKARGVLRDIFAKSADDLVSGVDSRVAALDIAWKDAQDGTLVFAVPREPAVIQRPGHSDIANSFVDYGA